MQYFIFVGICFGSFASFANPIIKLTQKNQEAEIHIGPKSFNIGTKPQKIDFFQTGEFFSCQFLSNTLSITATETFPKMQNAFCLESNVHLECDPLFFSAFTSINSKSLFLTTQENVVLPKHINIAEDFILKAHSVTAVGSVVTAKNIYCDAKQSMSILVSNIQACDLLFFKTDGVFKNIYSQIASTNLLYIQAAHLSGEAISIVKNISWDHIYGLHQRRIDSGKYLKNSYTGKSLRFDISGNFIDQAPIITAEKSYIKNGRNLLQGVEEWEYNWANVYNRKKGYWEGEHREHGFPQRKETVGPSFRGSAKALRGPTPEEDKNDDLLLTRFDDIIKTKESVNQQRIQKNNETFEEALSNFLQKSS